MPSCPHHFFRRNLEQISAMQVGNECHAYVVQTPAGRGAARPARARRGGRRAGRARGGAAGGHGSSSLNRAVPTLRVR